MGVLDRRRALSIVAAVVLALSPVGATCGVVGATGTQATADYTIDSVDAFDYYNSRGFEDSNGDGRVVITVTSTLDLSKSRDPTVRYGGDAPLVLRGSGGFTNPGGTLVRLRGDTDLTIRGLTITSIPRNNGYGHAALRADGTVVLRDVTVRDTGRFVFTGGDVRVVDSTFRRTGQVVKTDGTVTVSGTLIENASDDDHGVIRGDELVRLSDTTVRNVDGRNVGGIRSDSVVARNVTVADTDGAVWAEGEVTIEDSYLSDGSTVVTDGAVQISDSRLVDIRGDLAVDGGSVDIDHARLRHTSGIGDQYSSDITVTNSTLTDVGRLNGEDIVLRHVTVNRTSGRTAEAHSLRVEHSTIRNTQGLRGVDGVTVVDSVLSHTDRIDIGGSLTVRNSTLVSFGRFQSGNEYWQLRIVDSTIHGSSSPLVPAVNEQSIRRVNFIEAEPPVFEGRLPNKSMVFVDTTSDSEPPGEWTADVFWSREEPFPSVDSLPASAVRTPTTTPTATRTGTAADAAVATAATPTETTTRAPERDRTTERDRATATPATGSGFGPVIALLAAAAFTVLAGRRH
jgi:hypothetical protein